MRDAKLSVWNNKWTEIFDFTPKKSGLNYKINKEIVHEFVTSMK
jgi:hypothetical protein